MRNDKIYFWLGYFSVILFLFSVILKSESNYFKYFN